MRRSLDDTSANRDPGPVFHLLVGLERLLGDPGCQHDRLHPGEGNPLPESGSQARKQGADVGRVDVAEVIRGLRKLSGAGRNHVPERTAKPLDRGTEVPS
jgi:hypothetical protein